MTINRSDKCLICLLSLFVLMFVGAYCHTGDAGFLLLAIINGACLIGAIDIATLFWPYRA